MNERIKELWDKAAKEETDPSWEGQIKFMSKFAELIILETLEVARAGVEFGDSIETAVYTYFELGMTTEDKKTLIKEHFGVEE